MKTGGRYIRIVVLGFQEEEDAQELLVARLACSMAPAR
jgi:hypothetical protein